MTVYRFKQLQIIVSLTSFLSQKSQCSLGVLLHVCKSPWELAHLEYESENQGVTSSPPIHQSRM